MSHHVQGLEHFVRSVDMSDVPASCQIALLCCRLRLVQWSRVDVAHLSLQRRDGVDREFALAFMRPSLLQQLSAKQRDLGVS